MTDWMVEEIPYDVDVMVADDDEGLRTTTRAILEGRGYSVIEARDGEEALGLLESQSVAGSHPRPGDASSRRALAAEPGEPKPGDLAAKD